MRTAPARAVLLNTGEAVRRSVEMLPSDHREQTAYLRLWRLPVNERANEVLVIRLEFDADIVAAG